MNSFQKLECSNAINPHFLEKKLSCLSSDNLLSYSKDNKADQDQISVVTSFLRALEVHFERCLWHLNQELLAREGRPQIISEASWVLHISIQLLTGWWQVRAMRTHSTGTDVTLYLPQMKYAQRPGTKTQRKVVWVMSQGNWHLKSLSQWL